MMRALATALLCAAALIAAEVLFRTRLVQLLRPTILAPADQAVVDTPVVLRWEGPRQMHVLLWNAGEEQRDLGVHESPFEIGGDKFPRAGGYQLEVRALRFGSWIQATRWFQVHAVQATAPAEPGGQAAEVKDLLRALEVARAARDKAHGRTKFLRQENAALRDESERLAKQLEALYKQQEEDAEHAGELERRLAQLAEETRALADENAAMRLRLNSIIPCTVWGYYSYPYLQTIPPTRRVLMVSDMRGQVFRTQAECEVLRRADMTAASICYCVGNSWGG